MVKLVVLSYTRVAELESLSSTRVCACVYGNAINVMENWIS